jgi:hypothetical protein
MNAAEIEEAVSELVKIGARIVRHGCSITFQMAEVMVSRGLFRQILDAIDVIVSKGTDGDG